jgi:uncharacterized membrane protein
LTDGLLFVGFIHNRRESDLGRGVRMLMALGSFLTTIGFYLLALGFGLFGRIDNVTASWLRILGSVVLVLGATISVLAIARRRSSKGSST